MSSAAKTHQFRRIWWVFAALDTTLQSVSSPFRIAATSRTTLRPLAARRRTCGSAGRDTVPGVPEQPADVNVRGHQANHQQTHPQPEGGSGGWGAAIRTHPRVQTSNSSNWPSPATFADAWGSPAARRAPRCGAGKLRMRAARPCGALVRRNGRRPRRRGRGGHHRRGGQLSGRCRRQSRGNGNLVRQPLVARRNREMAGRNSRSSRRTSMPISSPGRRA